MTKTKEHQEDAYRKLVIEATRDALNKVGHPCHIAILADISHCENTKAVIQANSMEQYGFNLSVLSIGDLACRNFKIDGYWMEFDARINGGERHYKLNIGSIYQVSSPSYSGYTVTLPDTYLPDELMTEDQLKAFNRAGRITQDDVHGGEEDRNMQVMLQGKNRAGPPKLSIVK